MKILLVCESFSSRESGGRVARYIYDILTNKGHSVQVAVTSPFNELDSEYNRQRIAIFIPIARRFYKRILLFLGLINVPRQFSDLIQRFKPDVVHFASFDHSKPAILYKYCQQNRARVVLQPWTMHFYCAQGFGFCNGKQCSKCISEGVLSALLMKCISMRGLVLQLERIMLRRIATKYADIVLSSNNDLDNILCTYGFDQRQIYRFPVPFDPAKMHYGIGDNGGYYIFYGQPNSHKGVDLLVSIFAKLPDKKLRICPIGSYRPRPSLPPNISILEGIGWQSGLAQQVINSTAVIVPSLWSTSTEYSLCEAMALGKPVIAFNVGAHKEFLVHLRNALLLDPNDEVAFAEGLNRLENDNELYRTLVVNGLETIHSYNDACKLYKLLMEAYLRR